MEARTIPALPPDMRMTAIPAIPEPLETAKIVSELIISDSKSIPCHITGSVKKPAPISSSTRTIQYTGWGGVNRHYKRPRSADQPILLSVGYAACHWCHVMAHESFEDPDTADLMNQNFINIKVDREERPDIDRIYMAALHSLGEQGGWPLTMFLTPDALPFWGGTYFPPETRFGRPSFRHVLTEISRIWTQERNKITQNAEAISAALQQPRYVPGPNQLSSNDIHQAADVIINATDMQYGGLKGAPKFPQGPIFTFLWEVYLRTRNEESLGMPSLTALTQISNGGIYDHLGRRYRALFHRPSMAGTALRKNALRQCPVCEPAHARLAQNRKRSLSSHALSKPLSMSCAK